MMKTDADYFTLQLMTLHQIAEKCRRHYICKEKILPLLLVGSEKQYRELRIIDALYQSVQTSLQFQQYRRAAWYLIAFVRLCRRTLGEDASLQILSCLSVELGSTVV